MLHPAAGEPPKRLDFLLLDHATPRTVPSMPLTFPHEKVVEHDGGDEHAALGHVCQKAGMTVIRPVVTHMMMRAPTIVFATDPSPPENAVPPSSTAMMQSSSMPSPESGSPRDM